MKGRDCRPQGKAVALLQLMQEEFLAARVLGKTFPRQAAYLASQAAEKGARALIDINKGILNGPNCLAGTGRGGKSCMCSEIYSPDLSARGTKMRMVVPIFGALSTST